jgi:hypothetical protein
MTGSSSDGVGHLPNYLPLPKYPAACWNEVKIPSNGAVVERRFRIAGLRGTSFQVGIQPLSNLCVIWYYPPGFEVLFLQIPNRI